MISLLYLAQMRWNRSVYRSIIMTNGTLLASNWPSKVCQKQNTAHLALFSRCIVSKVCGTLELWQTWRERSWLCHVSFQGKILLLCNNWPFGYQDIQKLDNEMITKGIDNELLTLNFFVPKIGSAGGGHPKLLQYYIGVASPIYQKFIEGGSWSFFQF